MPNICNFGLTRHVYCRLNLTGEIILSILGERVVMELLIIGNRVQVEIFVRIIVTSIVSEVNIISSSCILIRWSNFLIIDDPSIRTIKKTVLHEYSWRTRFEILRSNSKVSKDIVVWSCNGVFIYIETIFDNHLFKGKIEIGRHIKFCTCISWKINHILHQIQRLE